VLHLLVSHTQVAPPLTFGLSASSRRSCVASCGAGVPSVCCLYIRRAYHLWEGSSFDLMARLSLALVPAW
jgi:hypothetical protein